MNDLRSFSRTTLATARLLGLAAFTSTAAFAGPVLTGGTEINTLGSAGANFMQGYDFVSTTNQSLTALGFWDSGADGLAASYQVGLWATLTQTLLASATLENSDPLDTSLTVNGGQWRYETLSSPIALTSGTTYTLGYQVGPVDLSATDLLLINHPTLTVAPTVTISNNTRFQGTASFTFPTSTGVANSNFRGNLNAQLVPEPGSALLLAVAGAGLLARRRRVA